MIEALRIGFKGAVLAVATLFLLPVHLLAQKFRWPIRRRIPRWWHRVACWMLGIRVRVHGVIEPRRPLMLAANHSSWQDIMVLASIADVVFIAKSEVKNWPVFGLLARWQESVFVVREEKRRTGEQVNEIGERMADGEIVVLFPEGTTSDGNRLLEVKSSLFGAAAAAFPASASGMVHIQPVAIAYTGIHGTPMGRYHRPISAWPGDVELVPHLKDLLKVGAIEVDVTFGETVDYTARSNRKQVASAVAASIRHHLMASLRGRPGE